MTIEQTDDGKNGIFYIKENGNILAEMIYRHLANNIIIEHTEVDPGLRNKGIGVKLIQAGVDYARKNNLKINPLCPFAKLIMKRTSEYADVLT